MFGSKQRGKVIAKRLNIVGSVTAEGLVEVDGQIDGELHCTFLVITLGVDKDRRTPNGRPFTRQLPQLQQGREEGGMPGYTVD